jgi:trans-2-enoyl-CoA reductase
VRKTVGIAGSTGVGSISSVGDGVSNLSYLDKVLVISSGVWADNVTVPATSVLKIPSKLSPEESANLPAYLSAYALLNNFADLKAGDIIIQSGGETAVGLAISQLGSSMGLKIVSATIAELEHAEFAKKVAAMEGKVKLTISNNSKKSVSKALLRVLSPGAALVLYNGDVSPVESDGVDVPVGSVIFKANAIYGFDFNVWAQTSAEEVQKAMTAVAAQLDLKKITLKSKVYPQSEYLKAMAEVESTGAPVVIKL